jgi:transcriptional regulator with XRE-family HTH domain
MTTTIVNGIFAIVMAMRARDVIVVARRRAGLTQQELGRRLGVPQATVARWESGFSEPKFDAVQRAVGACGYDLTLGFANADRGSWTSLIYEQLRLAPAERVRQLSHDRFDRPAALRAIGSSSVRAIVVGEVAGALHGWPLLLARQGGIELLVHPGDLEQAEDLLAALPERERIRLLDMLPGTSGYADLVRNSVGMDVDGTGVLVAALVDLLRVAYSDGARYSRRLARAFDETLRVSERLRQSPRPAGKRDLLSEGEAREEVERWLERQTAA